MAIPITVGSAGGEYMEAVVVLNWHVSPGDSVAQGDIVVTVETAKAAIDVEAPCDGVLSAIFADEGVEIPVVEVLGTIGASKDDVEVKAATLDQKHEHEHELEPMPALAPVSRQEEGRTAPARVVASPAARRAAETGGLDLSRIIATSPSGRIKLRDLPDDVPEAIVTSPFLQVPREVGPLKVYRSGTKTGVPLIMLHGFASDSQSWSPIERQLAAEYPIIRIDMPNHGKSPKRRVAGFRRLAREMAEAFDTLKLDRAHLVGHSLGGACALAVADIRPRKIASISLLAPGGLGPEIHRGFLDGIARASHLDSLEQWLKFMVEDDQLIGFDFVRAVMAMRCEPQLRASQLAMLGDVFPDGTPGFNLVAALERLVCPARIIWGKSDRVISWRNALTAPGRVGLHLLDRIGHAPQIEEPETVVSILKSVMAEGET